jgi:hypothetical protein
MIIKEFHTHTIRFIKLSVFEILQTINQKYSAENSDNTTRIHRKNGKEFINFLDMISIVNNILLISDTLTNTYQVTLSLICDVIQYYIDALKKKGMFTASRDSILEKDLTHLIGTLLRIIAISNVSINIKEICNASYLYFHLNTLAPIVTSIYQQVFRLFNFCCQLNYSFISLFDIQCMIFFSWIFYIIFLQVWHLRSGMRNLLMLNIFGYIS